MLQKQPYFTHTTPTLIVLVEWLIAPCIIIATLVALLFIYEVPLRGPYLALIVTTPLLSLLIFRQTELTKSCSNWAILASHNNIILLWLLEVAILLLLGYSTNYIHVYSQQILVIWCVVTPPFICLGHTAARWLLLKLMGIGKNVRTVVIAGINDLSRQLAEHIGKDPSLAMNLMGYFEDRTSHRTGALEHGQVLGKINQLVDFVKTHNIDSVYIVLPMTHEKRILQLLEDLYDTTASIYFVPDIFVLGLIQARIDAIHEVPVMAVYETPFHGISGAVKRLSDIVLTSGIILLTFPLMVVIAAGIKLTSQGPIIFKQRRYGLDGREIVIYKFRTLTVCEDGVEIRQVTAGDRRVTPFGAILRRYFLDELPQFINVLQGKMSLVGPRPHAVAHNETYRKLIKGYMLRHKVKPGVTGWAQVNGFRGETKTVAKMNDRIYHDLDYLRHWSLGLDIKIIVMTVLLMFMPAGKVRSIKVPEQKSYLGPWEE